MLAILVFSFLVHADQTPKAPAEIPAFIPKFTCYKQDIPACDQIESRLIEYNKNITMHAGSLVDYVAKVRDVVQSWYDDQFSPLQSGAIPLTENFFDFIPDNLVKVDDASTFVAQTKNCMKDELDKIIAAMQNCKK